MPPIADTDPGWYRAQKRLLDEVEHGVREANRAVIGFENAYNGAWLEIFLLENRPIGFVAAHKRQVLPAGGAMASLKIRAARPLHASDQACRLTVSRIIEHRQIWAEQRREGADPVAALTEES